MAELSLERVQIDGFRGLRGLDLDGLGRVNILIGANDSGKTSVLEVLSVLCKPGAPGEWLEMVRRRDFGELDEDVIDSARWCFHQSSDISGPATLFAGGCDFACEGRFPLRKLAVHYNERTDDGSGHETKGIMSQIPSVSPKGGQERGPVRRAELEYHLVWSKTAGGGLTTGGDGPDRQPIIRVKWWADDHGSGQGTEGMSCAGLPCETLAPYSHQINSLQVSSLSQQIIRDDADKGLTMLQGFDPDVMAVQVLSLRGRRPAIYVKHRRLGWAPLSIFGDAMRRCVLLAATLPGLKDGGVLLIDEVETGIHVKALGRVFEWVIESARQLNVQVFVTTHSLEALDALILAPSAQEGDVVAFRLARSDTLTTAKRFAGDLLLRLRQERGLDLR